MPKSTITGPDGNRYTVNHPEGASDEQVMRYVRQQVEAGTLDADTPERPSQDWSAQEAIRETQIDPMLSTISDVAQFGVDTVSNLPGSFGNIGLETAEAILNPMDTLRALGSVVQGGADWLGRQLSERQMGVEFGPTEDEETLRRLGDYYGERYGGRENLLETIRTDPMGMLMDVPLPVGAATGPVSRLNPVRATGAGARRALEPVGEAARRRDFISDIKPGTTMTKAERARLVDTAMDEGIDASPKGYSKLQDKIKEADDVVTERVAGLEGEIDAFEPLYALEENRRKARGNLATGTDDLQAINEVEARLLRNLERTDTTTVSPQEMNRWKRDLYRDIDWDDPTKTAENEALVAASGGARRSLENIDPQLAPDNARLGDLINLEEHLLRGSNRMENRHGPWWQWGGATPLLIAGGRGLERNAPNIPRALMDNPAIGAVTEAGWLSQAVEEPEVPYLYGRRP